MIFIATLAVAVAACSNFGTIKANPLRQPAQYTGNQKILRADRSTDSYQQIRSILGSDPETPDCGHKTFGPHITSSLDPQLRHSVFVFHIHVKPDNDRCINSDRQRVEIKTMGDAATPDYFKGFQGDTVTFRWKFKLPTGFQPSYSFTHLHQLKAFDGDDELPLITLTARKASPDVLQVIHIDSKKNTTVLKEGLPLDALRGVWVEVNEKITYGHAGKYSISVMRVSDGASLLSYSSSNLDLWRSGTSVVRPKWGIYRSLQHSEQLRDEDVDFDEFCLAKAPDNC